MDYFNFLFYLYIGVMFTYVFTPYPELIKKYPQLDNVKKGDGRASSPGRFAMVHKKDKRGAKKYQPRRNP